MKGESKNVATYKKQRHLGVVKKGGMKMCHLATKHGRRRVRQRLGLKTKAIDRLLEKVISDGTEKGDTTGALKTYLSKIPSSPEYTCYLYHRYVYLFAKGSLITTYAMPKNLYMTANNQNKGKTKTNKFNKRKEEEEYVTNARLWDENELYRA